MLSRMSIRTKITSVIAFMLVTIAMLGAFSIRQMQALNANTVDLQTNWLPSVQALGDLRSNVLTYRNVVRQHMLVETLEEKQAQEKLIDRIVEANTAVRAKYEKMIASDEERAVYNEWVQLWDSYKKSANDVMALSRQSVGKSTREAHELNTKTANAIGIKADEVLQKDVDLNNKGAETAGKDASESYALAFKLVIGAIGAVILAGIAIGFYLVRDVSTGIASIVKPMKSLGEGDLTAVVPHQGEKTEIGTMADTLQVFKDALIAKKAADEAAAADAEARSPAANVSTRSPATSRS